MFIESFNISHTKHAGLLPSVLVRLCGSLAGLNAVKSFKTDFLSHFYPSTMLAVQWIWAQAAPVSVAVAKPPSLEAA